MPALAQRPTIPRYSDPRIIESVCDSIAHGYSIRATAARAAIGKTTLKDWIALGNQELATLHGDPEPGSAAFFAACVESAYARFEEENVYFVREARSPDAKGWIPAMALLRSRNPEEWVEKHDRDANVNVTVNVLQVNVSSESEAALLQDQIRLGTIAQRMLAAAPADHGRVVEGEPPAPSPNFSSE